MPNPVIFPEHAGARFHRCALQVNPYAYLLRHGKKDEWGDETKYNEAVVTALRAAGVTVIAVTDHHRIAQSWGLIHAAEAAGLAVFPGFEYYANDGVHWLALLSPGTTEQAVHDVLAQMGIDNTNPEAHGKKSSVEFLEWVHERYTKRGDCTAIAAHICSDNGLLRLNAGAPKLNVWKHRFLTACAVPNRPESMAQEQHRSICTNVNVDYRRDHLPAFLYAGDVASPEDAPKATSSSWIKMSEITIEGLRQAFLDSGSRVRLTDPAESHPHIRSIEWTGGFFDGLKLAFSENLNALIGGRGAGKSTLLEGLRFALSGTDIVGEEARKNSQGIRAANIGRGGKVTLRIRTTKPALVDYRVEMQTDSQPKVFDEKTGNPIAGLQPADLIRGIQFFGQHEISEIARDPKKRTELLKRFAVDTGGIAERKKALASRFSDSRTQIVRQQKLQDDLRLKIAGLPAVEEALRQFSEAKVADHLKEKQQLEREKQVFSVFDERLQSAQEALMTLRDSFPLDSAFLRPDAIAESPRAELIAKLPPHLALLNAEAAKITAQLDAAIRAATEGNESVRTEWTKVESATDGRYQQVLRDLKTKGIDGADFIQKNRERDRLKKTREDLDLVTEHLEKLRKERAALLRERDELLAEELRALEAAAKRLQAKARHVRVNTVAGQVKNICAEMVKQLPGRKQELCTIIESKNNLDQVEFAAVCRRGSADLMAWNSSIPKAQADILAAAGDDFFMRMEELEPLRETGFELNVTPDAESPKWKKIDELSTGQKATAILLLLLSDDSAPLIVDQPEDDLDNRFISEVVVEMMRQTKDTRQFIFATHNANIPVLGDAELVIGLEGVGTRGGAGGEQGAICDGGAGSIDKPSVRELIKSVLEGGEAAFEKRGKKYGLNR